MLYITLQAQDHEMKMSVAVAYYRANESDADVV